MLLSPCGWWPFFATEDASVVLKIQAPPFFGPSWVLMLQGVEAFHQSGMNWKPFTSKLACMDRKRIGGLAGMEFQQFSNIGFEM